MQTRVGKIFSTEGGKTRKAKCAFTAAFPSSFKSICGVSVYFMRCNSVCEYTIPSARVNPLTISTASVFDYPTVETLG